MTRPINIIIVGDAGVGKSSLLESLDGQLNNKSISENIRNMQTTKNPIKYNNTITVKTIMETKTLLSTKNIFETVSLKLLDTAGQSKYAEDKENFLRYELESDNIHGIMILSDLSDINTTDTMNNYYNIIGAYNTNIPIVTIGNKMDKVSNEYIQSYINAMPKKSKHFKQIEFMTTSARTGDNVIKVFEKMLSMIKKSPVSIMKNEKTTTSTKRNRLFEEDDNNTKYRK